MKRFFLGFISLFIFFLLVFHSEKILGGFFLTLGNLTGNTHFYTFVSDPPLIRSAKYNMIMVGSGKKREILAELLGSGKTFTDTRILESLGDAIISPLSLSGGMMTGSQGDIEQAREYYRESLAISEDERVREKYFILTALLEHQEVGRETVTQGGGVKTEGYSNGTNVSEGSLSRSGALTQEERSILSSALSDLKMVDGIRGQYTDPSGGGRDSRSQYVNELYRTLSHDTGSDEKDW